MGAKYLWFDIGLKGMMMTDVNPRLDHVYNSQILSLPNIKIVSNQGVAGVNTVLYETKDTSPFQRNEDTVLTFIVEGNIQSYYGGIDTQFHVKSKTCTFIYGPTDNEYHVLPYHIMDSMAIGINKQFFYNLLQEDDPLVEGIINKIERKQPFSLSGGAYRLTPQMFTLINKIRNTEGIKSLRSLHLQNLLGELLLLQFHEAAISNEPEYSTNIREIDLKKLRELKEYLETNFLCELNLDFLVKVSGLNSFKLKTGFKALYKQSVFEYVRSLRMKYAHTLLLEGNHTISEVADIVGYEYVQHFSTAFKKYYGCPPGKFKY